MADLKTPPGVLFQEEAAPEAIGSPAAPEGEAGSGEGSEPCEAPPAADLDAQLAERDQHILGLREQIARTQADFENFRRRQQENAERDRFVAREGIVKSLLDPLDNLERALAALDATQDIAALRTGLELVLRQVRDVLGREGLEVIEADGKLLDTTQHQAVAVEQRDDVPDETIVETLIKGYTLGGRLLRPSMVKVARSS